MMGWVDIQHKNFEEKKIKEFNFFNKKTNSISMAEIRRYWTSHRGCNHGPRKCSDKVRKGFNGMRSINIYNLND
jgi:hypothetical protein